jgi:hypothetical protein
MAMKGVGPVVCAYICPTKCANPRLAEFALEFDHLNLNAMTETINRGWPQDATHAK